MKPRKIDKRKSTTSPLRLRGKKEMILARWTDGLFYFVKITKVSSINKSCVVEFEDKSIATVHFKDLLEEKEEAVTMCHSCGKCEAENSNILVKCDNCDRDYHQECHIPPITMSGDEADKFVCRICVFTSCAQAGGAKKSGPLALKYSEMKQYFPYDNKYLTWNATHTSNVEQCYCYCGGPGIWYNKMLQCCRCRQWFHEACMQCLETELLIGDRYFIFACAHCNYGAEFIQRMDLSWYDIGFITLFHLIMTLGRRYIDIDTDVVPFILTRAQTFGLKNLLNGLHGSFEVISSELIKVFHKHNMLFCCGSEVKKRFSFYGLRERVPPCPPPVTIPAADEVITAETLSSNSGRRAVFTPSKFTLQVPYVMRGGGNRVVPTTIGAKLRESKLAKIARVKSEHNYCTPLKHLDDSPPKRLVKSDELCWEGFDANNNSPSTTQSAPKVELDEVKFDVKASISLHEEEEVANVDEVVSPVAEPSLSISKEPQRSFWSLDTAFPEPLSFSGANHPFLTEFEQENLDKQRLHFERQLEILSTMLKENDAKKDTHTSCVLKSPISGSPTAIKDVKGFKGELADLINSTCSSGSPMSKTVPHKTELFIKEENLLDSLHPARNGVIHKRKHLKLSETKESKSSKLTSCHINGIKISPTGKVLNKKETNRIKSEAEKSKDRLEKVAEKRLKALNRCLKNLTPTCGFRFPVLEEKLSVLTNGTDFSPPNNVDAKKLAATGSLSPPVHAVSSKLNSDHSKSRKRVKKQKYDPVEFSRGSKHNSVENVRRSHRSRSTTQRFEAAAYNNFGFSDKGREFSAGLAGAKKYDVISLRVAPDNGMVEYLVSWSE